MRKFLIISLLASSSIIFAGEAEDFKTVNELYKEKIKILPEEKAE